MKARQNDLASNVDSGYFERPGQGMRFILTNYGHRYLQHLVRSGRLDDVLVQNDVRRLGRIFNAGDARKAIFPRLICKNEFKCNK